MANKDNKNAPVDGSKEAKAMAEAHEDEQPDENPYATVETLEETPEGEPNIIGFTGARMADVNASTYPGREKDLQETGGYLNDTVDAVRRARANGTRMPASAVGKTVDGKVVEDQ